MASFFSLLQKNVRNTQRWHSRQDMRLAIVTWTTELPPPQTATKARPAHLIEFEIINSHAAHAA
ncbi:hypothetical protein AEQ27_05510 [Frigoribacterium sp. RIT-PI-h]|nr:hypothetical protein AEQ27_05510 [Frigoribacterium sp. RIT-PI-h]